ncbi:MarR family winged helix-turn-helix transcriptional regulator [Leucobacter komagatae]|nr:MarR family transcriptional regulator [Leucobacter komagatae]
MDHKHALLLEHAGLRGQAAGATDLVMALLHTAARIDRACAAQLATFDLTEGRLSVMLVVASHEGATPALVADRLGITRAAVTGLLDGLERQGFVTRQGSATDRRSSTISLTESGSATLERVSPIYGEWLSALTAGIDDSAASAALATLDALQRNVEAFRSGAAQ